MDSFNKVFGALLALSIGLAGQACFAQAMPATAGETLSGKHIVLADVVHGHEAILVAGFSHEGGMKAGEWIKRIHADPALAGVTVYEVAMLEAAPSFVRGMIKSGMRKGMSPEQQDDFVVLTQDEKAWETCFGVGDDKEPYVMLIDAGGKVIWRGHGAASDLEPQLRAAAHQES